MIKSIRKDFREMIEEWQEGSIILRIGMSILLLGTTFIMVQVFTALFYILTAKYFWLGIILSGGGIALLAYNDSFLHIKEDKK